MRLSAPLSPFYSGFCVENHATPLEVHGDVYCNTLFYTGFVGLAAAADTTGKYAISGSQWNIKRSKGNERRISHFHTLSLKQLQIPSHCLYKGVGDIFKTRSRVLRTGCGLTCLVSQRHVNIFRTASGRILAERLYEAVYPKPAL